MQSGFATAVKHDEKPGSQASMAGGLDSAGRLLHMRRRMMMLGHARDLAACNPNAHLVVGGKV